MLHTKGESSFLLHTNGESYELFYSLQVDIIWIWPTCHTFCNTAAGVTTMCITTLYVSHSFTILFIFIYTYSQHILISYKQINLGRHKVYDISLNAFIHLDLRIFMFYLDWTPLQNHSTLLMHQCKPDFPEHVHNPFTILIISNY